MAFWNTLIDYASNVWDFAKDNPIPTGAVAGGVYNAATGKNVFEGAAAGAVLGWSADQIFDFGSGSGAIPGSGGSTSIGSNAVGSAAANVGSYVPTVNTTTIEGINAASNGVSQAATAGDFGNYGSKITGALDQMKEFGEKNPALTKLGIQGVSALYSMDQNEKLNKMRQDAASRQHAINAKNDGLADEANADARKMSATAASYDPRALGVRSMAQNRAATGRDVAQIYANKALDPTAQAALATKRRVRGAAEDVTSFNSGYDTGTRTQGQLYSTADSLRKNYSGSGYDATLAGDMSAANKTDSSNLTAMLESYLGNPSQRMEKKRAEEQGVMV